MGSDWSLCTLDFYKELCTGLQLIAVLLLFLIVAVSWYNLFSLHCQGLDVEEITNTSSKHPSMLIGVYSLPLVLIITIIVLAKKRSESSFLFSCFFRYPGQQKYIMSFNLRFYCKKKKNNNNNNSKWTDQITPNNGQKSSEMSENVVWSIKTNKRQPRSQGISPPRSGHPSPANEVE